MSEVKVHRPRYRLADKLKRGDQITSTRALAQARTRIDGLRAAMLKAVDRELAQLEGAATSDDPELRAEGVIAAADRVAGLVGGLEKLQDMATVALGLCQAVERMRQSGSWDNDAVAVHVSGLRLLRQGLGQMEARVLLAGLHKVQVRLKG